MVGFPIISEFPFMNPCSLEKGLLESLFHLVEPRHVHIMLEGWFVKADVGLLDPLNGLLRHYMRKQETRR